MVLYGAGRSPASTWSTLPREAATVRARVGVLRHPYLSTPTADKKAGNVKGIYDIHVIDVYLTSTRSSSWVFDTGAVAHICNSKQELRNKRRLAKDEVTMRVGNGSKVDVIAVGTLPLHLPSGLVLNLNNCYLVPALSMKPCIWISFNVRWLLI